VPTAVTSCETGWPVWAYRRGHVSGPRLRVGSQARQPPCSLRGLHRRPEAGCDRRWLLVFHAPRFLRGPFPRVWRAVVAGIPARAGRMWRVVSVEFPRALPEFSRLPALL